MAAPRPISEWDAPPPALMWLASGAERATLR
jgi:hypothetical protein